MSSSDTGEADPRLAGALAAWAQEPGPATRARCLAALAEARVFAAISARSTAEHVAPQTGLRAESSAEMALLSLVGEGGRRALPVFSDTATMRRWRLDARPVPVDGPQACSTALDDGMVALLVDPAGAAFVVREAELASLARGWVPVTGSALAARTTTTALTAPAQAPDPSLVAALGGVLAGEGLQAAVLLDGPDGLVLGVVPDRSWGPAQVAALAARVAGRLGPHLPADGLDLALVAPGTPGADVPLPSGGRGRLGRLRTGLRRRGR